MHCFLNKNANNNPAIHLSHDKLIQEQLHPYDTILIDVLDKLLTETLTQFATGKNWSKNPI